MTREGGHNTRLPLDAADRNVAAWDLDSNIVVEAGAGTGKTSLLVERALAALVGLGHPAERLVAITYTEKAAAEMRERLTAALEDLLAIATDRATPERRLRGEAVRAFERLAATAPAAERVSPVEIASRTREALERLDEASIGTIHSLASEMLRRHPRESGVDPAFVVDEEPRLRRLVDEMWPVFLADELGDGAARGDLWRDTLDRFEISALRPLAEKVSELTTPLGRGSSGPETTSHPAPGGQSDVPEAPSPIARLARKAAAPLRELSRQKLNDSPAGWVQSAIALLDRLGSEGSDALRSEAFVDDLVRAGGRLPSLGTKFEGDSEQAKEDMRAAQALIRQAARIDSAAIALAMDVLAPFGRAAREASLEAGFVTFDGLLLLARNLLRDHPDARAEEKQRAGILLVDEFQDTDPLQYEIVLFLAEQPDGPPAVDAFEAVLEPGKLFIVGDPKQSIYRFRGADIAAFDRAVKRVLDQGGRRCLLTANFRSVPQVLDPLNALFRSAFGGGDPPTQPAYEPIIAHRGLSDSKRPCVSLLSIEVTSGNARAESQRLREGRAIAAEIAAENAAGRSWSSMALLLPTMSNAPLYTRSLNDAGIPFVMEGGKVFGAKPETRVMLSILTAMADPRDAIAFLAVARSPLGAVSDAELARYVAAGRRLPPRRDEEIDPGEFPGLARTREILGRLSNRARVGRVDESIDSVLAETPVLSLGAIAWGGAQAVANMRTLVVRAARLARDEGLSLAAVNETLREELELRDRGETPLADDRLDAVRILTVHKAKGLEFDIVFVGDLRREGQKVPVSRGRTAACSLWRDPATGAEHAAVAIGSGRRETISEAEAVRRLVERSHQEAEQVRLFYVACTRARERLVLVQSDPKGKGNWTRLLAAWGYSCSDEGYPPEGTLAGGRVEHGILEDLPIVAVARPAGGERLAGAVAAFDSAFARARESDRPWIWSPTGRRAAADERGDFIAGVDPVAERRLEDFDEEESSALSGASIGTLDEVGADGSSPVGRRQRGPEVARAAGTAVHALLEAWDLRDPEWLRRQGGAFAVREAGTRAIEPAPVIREVGLILDRFLASPLPARLADLDIIGREVPVFSPVRQETGDAGGDPSPQPAHDRTHSTAIAKAETEGGYAMPSLMQGIVDLLYRDPDGTIVVADHKTDPVTPGDEDRLAAHYGPQLAAYAKALRACLPDGTPVRAELWLARSGQIVRVEAP